MFYTINKKGVWSMAWKDIKLRSKFAIGFGVILVLLAITCVGTYIGINGIVRNAEEVIDGNALRGSVTQGLVDHLNWTNAVSTFITDDTVHELKAQTDSHECAFGGWYYSEARTEAARLVPEIAPLLAAIEAPHDRLHSSAIDIADNYVEVDLQLAEFLQAKKNDHLLWTHAVKDGLISGTPDAMGDLQLDHTKCGLGVWIYSAEVETMGSQDPEFGALIDHVLQPHEDLHLSARDIILSLSDGDTGKAHDLYASRTDVVAADTLRSIDELISWQNARLSRFEEANDVFSTVTSVALKEVQALLNAVIESVSENIMTDDFMLQNAQTTQIIITILAFVSIVLGVVLASIIATGIINPIRKGVFFAQEVAKGDLGVSVDFDQSDEIGDLSAALNNMVRSLRVKAGALSQVAEGDLTIDVEMDSEKDTLGSSLIEMKDSLNQIMGEVSAAVEQVSSGSGQVSSASQSLSQGAAEQASSLEEISSSLSQISGQSKQNAQNALEANAIAMKAMTSAEAGNDQMKELVSAMEKISASSDETKKVVKVIDDIAFQINLLALNANVEAARAGKYGKGFAVVADEVRNLAVRSADAVKETTQIVEDSTKSIDDGKEVARTTAEKLAEIVEGSAKVAEFLGEIAAASREQAQGVEQINGGVEQIDHVTQANTASAEESAAAAEELAAQSRQLKAMIARFKLAESGTLALPAK